MPTFRLWNGHVCRLEVFSVLLTQWGCVFLVWGLCCWPLIGPTFREFGQTWKVGTNLNSSCLALYLSWGTGTWQCRLVHGMDTDMDEMNTGGLAIRVSIALWRKKDLKTILRLFNHLFFIWNLCILCKFMYFTLYV